MENLTNAVVSGFFAVMVAAVGVLTQRFVAWTKKEGLLTELKNKQAYVEIVVKATEQIYQEADGPAKLAKAKTQLVDYFQRKKIPFSESELDMLIEATVKSVKDGAVAGISDGKGEDK